MKASEALKQGKVLVIEIDGEKDMQSVIATLFQIGDQWIFVDIGWTDPVNSGHPFHLLDGELTGEGPWRLGRHKIEEIGPEDYLWRESQEWAAMALETGATTERAIQVAKSIFAL